MPMRKAVSMAAEMNSFAAAMAVGRSSPMAMNAAMAAENVQPVPCVCCVWIRGAKNSLN